jgi:hypothetical protein
MKYLPSLLLALAALAAPAFAQTPAQIKAELRTKEAAAKGDANALFEVGQWAAEKDLDQDATRIWKAVLKLEAGHEGANRALGNDEFEGKWMPAKQADALRKKAQEAEYREKGLVQVNGIWVEKEHVEDAKRGVFHHEGELVSKDEKRALMAGWVRHPHTGQLIPADQAEKAEKRYFPVAGNRWVDEKEADNWHSDLKRPWAVRSAYCTLVSTLPLATIEKLKNEADRGVERVQPIIGTANLRPTNRTIVIVCASRNELNELGAAVSDEDSSAGVFLAKQPVEMTGLGDVFPAICENDANWGERNVRHAAAISYARGVAAEADAELPLWFLQGIGGFTSRFQVDSDGGWFGKLQMQRGGLRSLKTFFTNYGFGDGTDIDSNLYEAGLLIAFAAQAGDTKATAALQDVTKALEERNKAGIDKAMGSLEKCLADSQQAVEAYLQQLIAKSP